MALGRVISGSVSKISLSEVGLWQYGGRIENGLLVPTINSLDLCCGSHMLDSIGQNVWMK
jgi:hypothetical protein